MIISSLSNEQTKRVIKLKDKSKARKEQGCFLVEGIKMVQEAPTDYVENIFVSEQFEKANKAVLRGIKYQTVSDSVFRKMTDTVTPQGILAVVRQKKTLLEEILPKADETKECYSVLDQIQDPGNLGTIVRTAEGAGVSAIIMSSTCADIYNPKVIRSTMGSVYRVPFVIVENLPRVVEYIKEAGVVCYAAHLQGESYNREIIYSFSIAND